jgi:hypothetical protein
MKLKYKSKAMETINQKEIQKEEKKKKKGVQDYIREKKARGETVKPTGGKRPGAGRKPSKVKNTDMNDLEQYIQEIKTNGGAVEIFKELAKKSPKEALLFIRDFKKGEKGGSDPRSPGDPGDQGPMTSELQALINLSKMPSLRIDEKEFPREVLPPEDQPPETDEETEEYQEETGESVLDVEEGN